MYELLVLDEKTWNHITVLQIICIKICYFFHWSISNSKSPRFTRTLQSILADFSSIIAFQFLH